MVKEVVKFETYDGSLFDTEEEAIDYENNTGGLVLDNYSDAYNILMNYADGCQKYEQGVDPVHITAYLSNGEDTTGRCIIDGDALRQIMSEGISWLFGGFREISKFTLDEFVEMSDDVIEYSISGIHKRKDDTLYWSSMTKAMSILKSILTGETVEYRYTYHTGSADELPNVIIYRGSAVFWRVDSSTDYHLTDKLVLILEKNEEI